MTTKTDSRSRFDESAPNEQIAIEVDLHDAQMDIFRSPARFRVAACGRRFGKTVLGAVECLLETIDNPGANVWWVAPTTRQTLIAKRQITKMLPRGFFHINNTRGEFTLANGSRLSLRSAERFDNLRGEGVDFMVVDEAAFIDEEAWTDALRPSLADRGGRALFISTFKGENWFWRLWEFANSPDHGDWEAFRFPTSRNPYIPESEIDAAARSLPREKFLQEFEASPMSFVGAVFDGELIALAAERGRLAPRPTAKWVHAGLDWGYHTTALEVCYESADDRITWVYEHIWEQIELNKRCKKIVEVCRDLNVDVIYADGAGITEIVTLEAALDEAKVRTEIQPVSFNVYKTVGIDVRRFYLENMLEDISPVCDGLISDSKRYHYEANGEKPAKGSDHTVDAVTAFYACKADLLVGARRLEQESVA